MCYDEFQFLRYSFDKKEGVLNMHYAYKDGPSFEENVSFPRAAVALDPGKHEALEQAFKLIFLLSGISYYKLYVPRRVVCPAFPLDKQTADFLNKIYYHGLGEFAYRNNVSVSKELFVCTQDAPHHKAVKVALKDRSLVPVGGGKDSIVSVETLKRNAEDLLLFAVGNVKGVAEPIRKSIETMGQPSVIIKRILSGELIKQNEKGALNGHIPITAILSSIAVASALLFDCNKVIFSNESSANEPTVFLGGQAVNHQYSKTLDFETDFADFTKYYVSPSVEYFSLLRPLTEAEIARRFSEMKKYHNVFRSCNAAFKQNNFERGKTWCCDCPKCRFVFLALAPFIKKVELVEIFGQNLLDDPRQLDGFRALCQEGVDKPFECVGEKKESAVLLKSLSANSDWKDDYIVRSLVPDFPLATENLASFLARRGPHRMPSRYRRGVC
ncbi:MAG: endonuclease domain-containing protein [Alphaproteobacteria bacterium]|nr:endonuclease domain-containing protein [Alphaproteobacteria bacterium]